MDDGLLHPTNGKELGEGPPLINLSRMLGYDILEMDSAGKPNPGGEDGGIFFELLSLIQVGHPILVLLQVIIEPVFFRS
jgi:hypothetical protein